MGNFEQRDNSGTLFRNERKESDKHPNATGRAMIGGVMYWVSAWTKDGAKGKFQSLSFKPCDEQGQQQAPARQAAPRKPAPPPRRQGPFGQPPPTFETVPEDDIPF